MFNRNFKRDMFPNLLVVHFKSKILLIIIIIIIIKDKIYPRTDHEGPEGA